MDTFDTNQIRNIYTQFILFYFTEAKGMGNFFSAFIDG